MDIVSNSYMPGDPRLVEQLVYELKSQGIFDQFRKECIADVDTKPAYQNLRQRVEGSVTSFLKQQAWKPDMNKNQLREQLRKNIYESGYLDTGVERIVDQVVNPKINTTFLPQVEDVVYRYLGIEKPTRSEIKKELKIDVTDLLPTDLEAISPESDHIKDDNLNLVDSLKSKSKMEEDESPPFEPIEVNNTITQEDENSVDSHLSGFSGLQSHDSNPCTESKVSQLELSNQESQASQNSSESRLSIITSEDNKMEICDDSNSKLLKSGDSNSQIEVSPPDTQLSFDYNPNHKNDIVRVNEESQSNYETNAMSEESTLKRYGDDKKHDRKTVDKKSRGSDKYSSSKDKKDDKYRKSSSSSKDKDKSSSKYSSSSKDRKESKSSSNSGKDKDKNEKDGQKSEKDKVKNEKDRNDRDRKDKDKYEKDKAEKDKSQKDKSSKDKDKGRISNSSSSSSKSNNKEKDKSSSKSDSDKKEREKSRLSSSGSSKDNKSKSNHSDSKYKSSSEKYKKEEKSSHSRNSGNTSSSKKDKDKKKDSKKDVKDDHYSSKDKRNDRRSTDRDSNDGRSSKSSQVNSFPDTNVSQTQKSSQESSNSNSGSGSGDSGNSDESEHLSKLSIKIEEPTKGKDSIVSNVNIQKLKYTKPKFASNFQEARKLMKIRKQLAKLERHNQLSLAQIEIPEEVSLINGVNCTANNTKSDTITNAVSKQVEINGSETESETAPVIQSTELSQANWEALEARLAQEMSNVNYNSYESPYDESEYGTISPKKESPKVIKEHVPQVDEVIEESVETVLCEQNITELVKSNYVLEDLKDTEITEEENYSGETSDNKTLAEVTDKETEENISIDHVSADIVKNECKEMYEDNKMETNNVQHSNHEQDQHILSTGNTNIDNQCVYLEPPNPKLEKNLQFLYRYIEKLEQDVEHSLKMFHNNFAPLRTNRKRQFSETVDIRNNNKASYLEITDVKKRKRSVAPNPNSVIPKANKVKLCNISDISTHDSFSLPLSPAESDKSTEKKDEEYPKAKQKRDTVSRSINARANQRYSSEDLYKPRPIFQSSRRSRGAKNAEK